MDPGAADRLVAAGYARHETERERKCAIAVGHKRPKNGVKAPDPASAPSKAKAKGKRKAAKAPAEDAPQEG